MKIKNVTHYGANKSASSSSLDLKAISGGESKFSSKWYFSDEEGKEFGIFVVRNEQARISAQKLVHRMYLQRGYVDRHSPENSRVLLPFASRTVTLLVEDESGCAAGTVSLVFDSPVGLPSDAMYRSELDQFRMNERRLVEVVCLAIHERHANSKELLVQIFNFISIYTRRIRQYTDFVVSVNPRHSAFYRRLLEFKVAGPECVCHRVHGAPALLLRLDLKIADPKNRKRFRSSHSRTLYLSFSSLEEENKIVLFFKDANVLAPDF